MFSLSDPSVQVLLPPGFVAQIDVQAGSDPCWLWTGVLDPQGYGRFTRGRSDRYAHRVSYAALIEPIPRGHHLHHRCAIKRCVQPAHLDPLTPKQHIYATPTHVATLNAAKTHCKHGHPFTEENTYLYHRANGYVQRFCLTCGRDAARRSYWRRILGGAS